MRTQRTQDGIGNLTIIGIVAIILIIGAVVVSGSGNDRTAATSQSETTVAQSEPASNPALEPISSADDPEIVAMEKSETDEAMTDETMKKTEGEAMMSDHDEAAVMEKEPAAAIADTDVMEKPEAAPVVATTPGTFSDFDESKLALAADGDVVLFFHAAWCPSCRALESNINANLSAIPANTHILKVDYDAETALKQKYGVNRQHTLVQVDSAGNKIKTLTGLTSTLDQVVSQI